MMLEVHSALILFMEKGGEEETALPDRQSVGRSPSCGPKINYDGGARAATAAAAAHDVRRAEGGAGAMSVTRAKYSFARQSAL